MSTFPQITSWRKNPFIYSIIAVNVVVYVTLHYVLQIPNPAASCFGGLQPYKVISQGEYWRLLSSVFMHYDFSHILFNMVALLIFGSYAETFFGHWRAILIYVSSGLFANLVALGVVYLLGNANYCAIGASGAILGLAAGTAYLMWRTWRQSRNPAAYIFARQLVIILLIQFTLDFVIKESSFLHHFSGALAGVVIAYFMTINKYN